MAPEGKQGAELRYTHPAGLVSSPRHLWGADAHASRLPSDMI